MNLALEVFAKPLSELMGDEGQRDIIENLKAEQQRRQDALDEAATYHDDPRLILAFFDEVTAGPFHDAFVRMCQDAIETREGHSLEVRPEFIRAVHEIAIHWANGG